MVRPTWGDSVRIRSDAAAHLGPGQVGAVCGVRRVENDEQATRFGRAIGVTVVLVEFEDGVSLEVPEDLVEVVESDGQ